MSHTLGHGDTCRLTAHPTPSTLHCDSIPPHAWPPPGVEGGKESILVRSRPLYMLLFTFTYKTQIQRYNY